MNGASPGSSPRSPDELEAFKKGRPKKKRASIDSNPEVQQFGVGGEGVVSPRLTTYKNMMETGELTANTTTQKGHAGAGHEAVQTRRNRSSIRPGSILLERVAIPTDYFQGHVSRNPFTGKVQMRNLHPQYDFTHVDLFDRDFVLAQPDEMGRDSYVYQAEALGYRTWILQSWASMQSEGLQGGKFTAGDGNLDILEMTKTDMQEKALSFSMIDQNGSAFGRYSPFTVISAVLLLICMTVDIPLMATTIFLFVFLFLVTTQTNGPALFRFHRLISAPIRIPVTLVVAARLSSIAVYAAEGKWVPIGALILAFLVLLADFIFGDLANASAFTAEKRYKILRSLPGNVWICKAVGGTEDTMGDVPIGSGAEDGVDEAIAGITHLGLHPRELKGTCIICDVQGLFVKLHACSPMHWREHLRYGRQQIPIFSTRTFNNVRPTGEFFMEDGKPRNLFEILGLNSDGSANQSSDKASGMRGRQSIMGRRGTYMVTSNPEGIPQEMGVPKPPPGVPGRMPRATDAMPDDDDDDLGLKSTDTLRAAGRGQVPAKRGSVSAFR